MDRRKAIAVAGTVGVTLAAATAAVFANVSMLSGQDGPDGVGELDAQSVAQLVAEEPTTTAPAPSAPGEIPSTTIVYVDEYVTVPAGSPAAAGAAGAANPAAVVPSLPGAAAEHVAALDPAAPPVGGPALTVEPAPAPAPPVGDDPGTSYDDDDDGHDDDAYEDEDSWDDDHDEDEYEAHEYEDDDD